MSKYVIDICKENGENFSQSEWIITQAIRTALKTLSHKKHNLGNVKVLSVDPVQGSVGFAIDMVRAIKDEARDTTATAVDFAIDENNDYIAQQVGRSCC